MEKVLWAAAEFPFELLHAAVVSCFDAIEDKDLGNKENKISDEEASVDLSHFKPSAKMKLEFMGYRVGYSLVERMCKEFPRFANELECMKFLCKELWSTVFRKQVDNLRTNHQGMYVVQDNHFFLLVPLSTGQQYKECAYKYLAFTCGLISGALANLGTKASVTAEVIQTLPQNVPFIAPLNDELVVGSCLIVKGCVLASSVGGSSDFVINLTCGLLVEGAIRDDIAFHFNPRFSGHRDSGNLVINTLLGNKWGKEQRVSNPFCAHNKFDLRVFVMKNCFRIALKAKPLCDFGHRVPFSAVKALYIRGNVSLNLVKFEIPDNEGDLHSVSNVSSCSEQSSLNDSVNTLYSCNIRKPPVPFIYDLLDPLNIGSKIFLTAVPTSGPIRFEIDFMSGSDCAFHFNPRFKEGVAVRNTQRGGTWEKEERFSPGFPFLPSGTFDMEVICETDRFVVLVNCAEFITYTYRMDIATITQIQILGDVKIVLFRIQ